MRNVRGSAVFFAARDCADNRARPLLHVEHRLSLVQPYRLRRRSVVCVDPATNAFSERSGSIIRTSWASRSSASVNNRAAFFRSDFSTPRLRRRAGCKRKLAARSSSFFTTAIMISARRSPLLRERHTGREDALNFQFANKIQKQFSPLVCEARSARMAEQIWRASCRTTLLPSWSITSKRLRHRTSLNSATTCMRAWDCWMEFEWNDRVIPNSGNERSRSTITLSTFVGRRNCSRAIPRREAAASQRRGSISWNFRRRNIDADANQLRRAIRDCAGCNRSSAARITWPERVSAKYLNETDAPGVTFVQREDIADRTTRILGPDGIAAAQDRDHLFSVDRWQRNSRDRARERTRGARPHGSFLQLRKTGAARPFGAANSLPPGCGRSKQFVPVSRLHPAARRQDGGGRAQQNELDVFHVHYAVPHATAAFLATEMIGDSAPKIVTTLHGTDTTLLGPEPRLPRRDRTRAHSFRCGHDCFGKSATTNGGNLSTPRNKSKSFRISSRRRRQRRVANKCGASLESRTSSSSCTCPISGRSSASIFCCR